jgi:hypothetical protein
MDTTTLTFGLDYREREMLVFLLGSAELRINENIGKRDEYLPYANIGAYRDLINSLRDRLNSL